MKKIQILAACFTVACALLSFPAAAHHSFAATFTEETITVKGVVERLSFTNPHVIVYFKVTDESGKQQEWMSEGNAATLLRRQGWARDTLEKGDHIQITGNSSRNGSPMVSMESVDFLDPKTGVVLGPVGSQERVAEASTTNPMKLANGLPNLSGAWARVRNRGARAGGDDRAAGGGRAMGAGGGRAMGAGGGPDRGAGRAAVPFNEEAAALQAKFDPLNDPQVQCEPPGLVRQAGSTPHPSRIAQFDDHVVLSYEEYGGVRKIYFDDRDLVDGEHTHLGQSIARYDGEKLIIETTHLRGNLTNPGGNALSDQTTTRETYSRSPDANDSSVLNMEMIVTDPGHLTKPWVLSSQRTLIADYEFIEVDCQKPLAN